MEKRILRNRNTFKSSKYYDDFVCMMTTEETPEIYKEAISSTKRNAWKNAMNDEIASLKGK